MQVLTIPSLVWICFCIFQIFAPQCHGYGKCINSKPVGVDEDWYFSVGESGFHFPMHSDCNNCKPNETWQWLSGRSAEQKVCWEIDLDTRWGAVRLPLNCQYSQLSQQYCKIDSSKAAGKVRKHVGGAGTIVYTITDNSTYIGGTLCVYGKENIWFVVSTTKTLKPAVKKLLLAHFEASGFKKAIVANPKNKDKSPVIFKAVTLNPNECAVPEDDKEEGEGEGDEGEGSE